MRKNQRTVTFNHNPLLKRELPMWRPRFVLLALLAGSLTLTGRALYLQGVNNDFLQAKGESRYARTLEIPATRGRITDRHGDMLAVSTPVRSVWAMPSDAKLEPAQARELARMLEMEVNELNDKLATQRDFVYLKRQLSPELAQRIADLKLPGIHEQKEYRRYYPGGEVSAHMLYDMVYNPPETAFLRKGREAGASTMNGRRMLEIQARETWKLFLSACH